MSRANDFLAAAASGDTDRLLDLLAEQPDALDSTDRKGNSALCLASARGDVDMVRALIEHGADLALGDPVRSASRRNHVHVVRALAEAGVEVDFVVACKAGLMQRAAELLEQSPELVHATDDGFAIIDWVCEAGNVDVGRALVTAGAPADVFTCASLGLIEDLNRHLETSPDLLEARRTLFDYRPLHCAAECGQAEAVALLLDRGADANAPNEWGATPVFFAVIAARHHPATEGHFHCCKLLLERGARVIANVKPDEPLSQFAQNAIAYAPDEPSKVLAREILDYVRGKEQLA